MVIWLQFTKGNPNIHEYVAILAPGTGLGEARLFWDGKRFETICNRGGHSNFLQEIKREVEFWRTPELYFIYHKLKL